MVLRPFSAASDRDIFAARTDEVGAKGDGSGGPAADLDDEIRAAKERFDAEAAAQQFADLGIDELVEDGVLRLHQRRDPARLQAPRLRHCRAGQVATGTGGLFSRGAAGDSGTRGHTRLAGARGS